MATPATATDTPVDQLDKQRRSVSYDGYDITVRQLLDMVANAEVNIAPEYQRHFVWTADRESALVESIFLGIPVPSLFMAANTDGTWDVIDGVQRLSTLLHFCWTDCMPGRIGREVALKLTGLQKLPSFNGNTFSDLPKSVQLRFTLSSLRVTVLNDKSDLSVRYDLFERLNTGGVLLHPQEIRNCIFRGRLRDQIKMLAKCSSFRQVVKLTVSEQTEAVYEECILRFFAYLDRYMAFDHLVGQFLTDFAKDANLKGVPEERIRVFRSTMAFLRDDLPSGIVRGRSATTPLNLYEAVSVGTGLVILTGAHPKGGVLKRLINSAELRKLTQGGTNSRKMVIQRLELVRDALL